MHSELRLVPRSEPSAASTGAQAAGHSAGQRGRGWRNGISCSSVKILRLLRMWATYVGIGIELSEMDLDVRGYQAVRRREIGLLCLGQFGALDPVV